MVQWGNLPPTIESKDWGHLDSLVVSKLIFSAFVMAILVGVSVVYASQQLQPNEPIPPQEDYIQARVYSDEFIKQRNEANLLERRLALLRRCESGDNPKALNPSDTNYKRSVGLYQFQDATWAATIKRYNLQGTDIWNGEHQHIAVKAMWYGKENFYGHFPTCWKLIMK